MKKHWCTTVLLGFLTFGVACKGTGGERPEVASSDETLVARVGGRPVTKSYFESRLEKMDRKFLPDTLDLVGKRKFLDFIVNKELMALKAEELNYDEDPQTQQSVQLIEENYLHNAAVEQVTAGKAEPTEEDVQRFYTLKSNKVVAKHVLAATHDDIDEIYAALQSGADFDSLIRDRSTVPYETPAGEALPHEQRAIFGEVEYGKTHPDIERAIFETPIKQISTPVQSNYGWHIFMPFLATPNSQRELGDERALIEQQIRMRKRRVLVNEYYEGILAKHGFKLDESAMEFLFSKLPADVDPEQRPDPALEVKPVIPFNIAERARMLFMLDGKKYTLGDFSDRYDATSWFERPKPGTGVLGMYYWIRDGWLKPLQLAEARERGYAKLPSFMADVAMRREQLMVSVLHANLIAGQIEEPTEAEIQVFYDKHAAVYVEKEKRICNLIFNKREAVVRRAHEEIVNGADFVETAIRYNENATEASEVQTPAFNRDDPGYAGIAEVAWSLNKGEYSEPFKTVEQSQGWVLLQVQVIIPEKPMPLKDITEFVVRDIHNERGEALLNQLLEQWKQEYDVEVFDKALESAAVRRSDVVVPGKIEGGAE